MKRGFFEIIVPWLCIFGFGCQDDSAVNPNGDTYMLQLYSSWEWVTSVGGYAVTVRTPQSTGQTAKIAFFPDGRVQYFRNDTLVNEVTYTVKKDTSFSPASYLIHYNSTTYSPDQFIQYSGTDTLYLVDACMDCYRHTYFKLYE